VLNIVTAYSFTSKPSNSYRPPGFFKAFLLAWQQYRACDKSK